MVVIRLIESDIVLSINDEVASINIVTLENHLEHLWLMNCTFLHEIDNFILDNNSMVDIVIELYLHFIFHLTSLRQEILLFNWFCEVLIVFSQQVKLADMGPGVKPIT